MQALNKETEAIIEILGDTLFGDLPKIDSTNVVGEGSLDMLQVIIGRLFGRPITTVRTIISTFLNDPESYRSEMIGLISQIYGYPSVNNIYQGLNCLGCYMDILKRAVESTSTDEELQMVYENRIIPLLRAGAEAEELSESEKLLTVVQNKRGDEYANLLGEFEDLVKEATGVSLDMIINKAMADGTDPNELYKEVNDLLNQAMKNGKIDSTELSSIAQRGIDMIREVAVEENLPMESFDTRKKQNPYEKVVNKLYPKKSGIRVGVAGSPNAGKSTLLNALSGDETIH